MSQPSVIGARRGGTRQAICLFCATVLALATTLHAEAAEECSASIGLSTTEVSPDARRITYTVQAPQHCEWRIVSLSPHAYVGRASGEGVSAGYISVAANDTFERRDIALAFNGVPFVLSQQPSLDADHDGLPDSWERQFGLSVSPYADAFDSFGDPDFDGQTNAQELQLGTHPNAKSEYSLYFAEGAGGSFQTLLALANFGNQSVCALVSTLGPSGVLERIPVTIPAQSAQYLDLAARAALENTPFSIIVESTSDLVVDRVQALDGGGVHSERAVSRSEMETARQWVIAEGTTAAGFNLFYLIANPNDVSVNVTLTYYFDATRPPIDRTFTVGPLARHTIWVNQEGTDVAGRDVSARLVADAPIVAEYAMYRTADSGQRTAALAARAQRVSAVGYQIFAEGATGPFFDTFIAVANTISEPVSVPFRYLLPDGRSVLRTYIIPAQSRYTIWADQDAELADTAFGFEVNALPGVAVHRTMLWPGDAARWYEGHTSGSSRLTTDFHTAWGENSATDECYFLLANPSDSPAVVDVTLLLEGGDTTSRAIVVAAGSRANVSIRAAFPESAGSRFAAHVRARYGGVIAADQSTYRTPTGAPLFLQGSSKPLK